MIKKILVIGSSGHSLADKCIEWEEIKSSHEEFPYLGDYHLIIINLQTLHESDITKMDEQFKKIRKQINEIIWANTEIICITSPTIVKGEIKTDYEFKIVPQISNYHWCPIYLNFVKQKGESFEEKPSGGYFDFVKKWSHFLEDWSKKNYILQKGEYVEEHFEKLLKNLAKKLLSFKLYFVEIDLSDKEFTSNPIIFLPPPTEISMEEAINYLLKEARGITGIKENELPVWTEKLKIYGEERIKRKIEKKKKLKEKYEMELEEHKLKLSQIIKFKRLLTTNGEELENIIEETFKLFGIDIKRGEKGKEDRIVIDPSTKSELPVEITGVKKSIPEIKLNQLIGRLGNEERLKKIKCKCRGILIGNHYKDTPLNYNLEGRRTPFESDLIKKAETCKIALLSTLELFKALNAKFQKKDKKIKSFINKIFNKPGEIKFK